MSSRVLRGIGVSPGCVVGPALVVHWQLPDVPDRIVSEEEIEGEVTRLREAVDAVRLHLAELRERTHERAGSEEAKIFDAQILMLDDVDFRSGVERLMRQNQLSAERAFEFETLEVRDRWAKSPSAMLRQRAADLLGVAVRVLQRLMGNSIAEHLHEHKGPPAIILTRELSPGLTVEFDTDRVAGFASVEGTRTSHAAILAHSLGIPCVMGLVGGLDAVESGAQIILDGSRGTIIVQPTRDEIDTSLERERKRKAFERELASVRNEPSVTPDDVRIELKANVDLPEELEVAFQNGARGVGLLRTEFMILGRSELPTEEEQFKYFKRIAERFPDDSIIVRSYDLGGDKFPAAYRPPQEANPFLGWRAIRVCLDQPEIFSDQIRALLRARLHGDIQLMLPLITQMDELEQVRGLVAEARAALARDGVPCADTLPIGVMIETPAAAVLADELAAASDFLSVGTNDLTQYVLAVDRGNASLADRFSPYHPAVIRLLKHIVDAGERAGLKVSVCGEMASEPLAALLLLGLGYSVLSVAPPRLTQIRWLVRRIAVNEARPIAERALQAATTKRVTELLTEGLREVVDLGGWLPDQ